MAKTLESEERVEKSEKKLDIFKKWEKVGEGGALNFINMHELQLFFLNY